MKNLKGKRWHKARMEAMARARHRCKECGERGVRLDVDHIIARADGGKLYDQDNLQVLCVKCHSRKTYKEKRPERAERFEAWDNQHQATKAQSNITSTIEVKQNVKERQNEVGTQ